MRATILFCQSVVSAVLAIAALPACGLGQSSARLQTAGKFVLHVEPVAVGAQYSVAMGTRWRVGPQLILGPFLGVSLHRRSQQNLKEWASAYLCARFAVVDRVVLAVAPLGASLVVGNDFAAVYPTGQIGGDYAIGRVLVGSDVRVIRIAGPDGRGDYWTRWIPLRIGIILGG